MSRSVFFSFHFDNDFSRTQLVRNMGALTGNPPAAKNRWESIRNTGDAAIKKWIDDNMKGKSCLVVLIGRETASRPWVRYEIKKAWTDGRGVLGVRIHKLKDLAGNTGKRGKSPFDGLSVDGVSLAGAPVLDPSGGTSKEAYATIEAGISDAIEDAIAYRKAR